MKIVTTLEIWPENLPGTYAWDAANEACEAIGKGWRLPTRDELNLLYRHKDEIGGLGEDWLWSSSQNDYNYAWIQSFSVGHQYDSYKGNDYGVRAVRATIIAAEGQCEDDKDIEIKCLQNMIEQRDMARMRVVPIIARLTKEKKELQEFIANEANWLEEQGFGTDAERFRAKGGEE